MTRRFLIAICLLSIVPGFGAQARDAREQRRIDYLIDSLSSLHGAVFIRNGKEYSSELARDHLRQKLQAAGDRVKTAEDFIKYCASESYLSHQPYRIRFADGKVTDTAPFFLERLREFETARP